MGRYALVQAWSQVLAGKESEVVPLLGARENVLDPLYEDAGPDVEEEPYALADQMLGPWQMLMFVLYFFIDVLWTSRVLRTIVLPQPAVATLVQEARDDVSKIHVESGPAFVSTGDVLTAWATRLAASELPMDSARPVMIGTVFELRSRLKSLFQSGGAYVQNLVLSATAILPAKELLGNSLGYVALRIRQTITEQTSEAQIRAQARLIRECYEKKRHGPGFGKANNFIVVFSNWLKGDFFNIVDFSPAVISPTKEKSADGSSGKPVYYHCQTLQKMPTSSNIFNILGRDRSGSVWMTGYLPLSVWTTVQKELDRLA